MYVDINAVDNRRQRIVAPKLTKNQEAPSRARHEIRTGDVIFSLVRPYLKNIAVVPPELDRQIASSAFCVLRPGEGLLPDYLFYVVSADSFIASVPTYGHSPPAGRDDELLGLGMLLPPVDEQRRIVEAIEAHTSRVGAGKEALASAIAKLGRYRDLLVRAAVTGRATGPERAGIGARVPEHWQWTELGKIAEIVGGVTKDAKRELRPGLVEVPYLRVANVQRGYLDLAGVKTIRVTAGEADALRLLPGDILFNEGGDRDKLGRGWVWSGEIEPCIHQNHVFRARLSNPEIDPRFVSLYSNAMGQDFFSSHGRQTTNLASISKTQLAKLPIPLPPPDEQREIVERIDRHLSVIDELLREARVALHRAAVLSQALLTQAVWIRLIEAPA